MFAESKVSEFKREYTDHILRTVIAFANTDGGKLYIGIEDDGTVRGVDDVDEVGLRATNAIRDSVRPDVTLFVETGVEQMNGRAVLVIAVQRGTARPYYLASRGLRPEGVFVRQGASTVPATATAILAMIKETSGDCYETAHSLEQQLTFEQASAFFAKKDIAFAESQKRTLQLMDENGTYANLALLLSDQCVHTIRLAVFEGDKKSVFRERREFSGSLLQQLEEAYDCIDRFNRTRAEFRGLERIDMRDYPREAIREALLNAIVHRDYAFSASALISIFDDRLEFVTVGGLMQGVSLEDIMLGVSVLRNQRLANVFYRLGLIEAYGIGLPKIMGAYDGYAVQPQIEVTDNAFKVTLPNTNSPPAAVMEAPLGVVNAREQQVLALLNEQYYIVRKDVERVANVSQATAIVLLREMVRKGLLQKVGSGRLVKYKLR